MVKLLSVDGEAIFQCEFNWAWFLNSWTALKISLARFSLIVALIVLTKTAS